jgi:nitrogenase iron protein NifH
LAIFAPQSAEAEVFNDIVSQLLDQPAHYPAAQFSDAQFDDIIAGRFSGNVHQPIADAASSTNPLVDACAFTQIASDLQFCNIEEMPDEPFYYRNKPIRQPIWCCAFQTATRTALRMRDAVVVAHAPRSCAYMCRAGICSGAAKDLKRRRKYRADMISPNLVCTDMTVPHMIYGGTELLTQTLIDALKKRPPVVFLTTACPPAIIGDDIVAAIRQAQATCPETRIIPLRTDGNMTGGGMNGHLSAMFDGLLSGVDASPDAVVQPRCVNLIGNWSHDQSRVIRQILTDVGVSVNVSFSVNERDPRAENLRFLNRAPLTLIGSINVLTSATAKFLRERFGTELAQYPFPKGFQETAMWLRDIGDFFGIQQRVEKYLAPRQAAYDKTLAKCRKVLAGKRVVVFYWNHPMNWILDVMLDCQIDVSFVGMMVREEDIRYPFRYRDSLPVEFGFHPDRRREVLDAIQPDAVFTSMAHDLPGEYPVLDTAGITDDDVAFEPGDTLVRRWANLMMLKGREKWRFDFVPEDRRTLALGRQSGERLEK